MKTKEQNINHLKGNTEISFEDLGMSEMDFLSQIENAFNEPEIQNTIVAPKENKTEIAVIIPSLEGEEFKSIPNHPDYQISNLGRVKSFKSVAPIVMKPQKQSKGYHQVALYTNGKLHLLLVQVLMGITFFGIRSERGKTTIDHKNGIKTDNRLENLQVLSHRQNISKGYKTKKTSSKFTGVTKVHNGTFTARIFLDGKQNHLGTFKTPQEASKAYRKALLKNRVQTILQAA